MMKFILSLIEKFSEKIAIRKKKEKKLDQMAVYDIMEEFFVTDIKDHSGKIVSKPKELAK
jgi:hypothetical protein